MLLLGRVRRTVLDRGLIPRGASIVVGTSGGPDSTALLDVMARLAGELDLRVIAAGIDHGLREGAGAELDVAERNAAARGVRFERVRVSVAPGSVQAAAREARYAALDAVATRNGASHVAVGHTLDDQAETVIARVIRGSGLRGLAGIDPGRADRVVRPLIDACRADVLAYLADVGLPFVEDPSNRDPRFERSRIRHTVLPALLAESPEARVHLAWLADEAREAEALLESLAATLLADAASADGIDLGQLRAAPRVVALRALRRAIGPEIGRAHLSSLAQWLQDGSDGTDAAEIELTRGRTARIERGRLVVSPLGRREPDEEA